MGLCLTDVFYFCYCANIATQWDGSKWVYLSQFLFGSHLIIIVSCFFTLNFSEYCLFLASLSGDSLVLVSLEISHLIVSGTTEKHKQRSSTEDNKNEHCDIRWMWSLWPWHIVRWVHTQAVGHHNHQYCILIHVWHVMVVEEDKYNDSHDVTFVLMNNVTVETKKECSPLEHCIGSVHEPCHRILLSSITYIQFNWRIQPLHQTIFCHRTAVLCHNPFLTQSGCSYG